MRPRASAGSPYAHCPAPHGAMHRGTARLPNGLAGIVDGRGALDNRVPTRLMNGTGQAPGRAGPLPIRDLGAGGLRNSQVGRLFTIFAQVIASDGCARRVVPCG